MAAIASPGIVYQWQKHFIITNCILIWVYDIPLSSSFDLCTIAKFVNNNRNSLGHLIFTLISLSNLTQQSLIYRKP